MFQGREEAFSGSVVPHPVKPAATTASKINAAQRLQLILRVCAKINSNFAGWDWAGWQGATSEHTRAVC
ncbi:MAG TPA: hypothetical protein P5555_16170, partial [Candidatus Paceibacterota bacterium]|nr:hypothetical protein [Verrucomicrobiota bacterium]HRZ46717.1 hypothetical protein [Candidatus Paceibacterota bacterium]